MLTLRQRIFVGIGVVVGIIIAILLVVLLVRAPQDEIENPTQSNIIDSNSGPLIVDTTEIIADTNQLPINQEPPEELYVKNTARIFVERFFTYSNQNSNEHIADVVSLATTGMQTYMQSQKIAQSQDSYSGMTTRVLTTDLSSFDSDAGTAQVRIGAQQTIAIRENGSTQVVENIVLKEGTVAFEKVQETWKVAGVFWD